MRKTPVCLLAAAALLCAAAAHAADAAAGAGEDAKKTTPATAPPKPEQSVTRHSLTIGGTRIDYTATAGTLIVRNAKDEPYAAMGYTAYTRRGAGDDANADAGRRPIAFAYNGGPGSSSVWLHMGSLGPRRIVTADAGATPPPPYRAVDNAESVLDKTDLVMIDPVGTGLSHAVGEAKDKDFWAVDPDIESVSRFIKQYVTDNRRWNSPKYLIGESYGTTRSAGIVDYLMTNENMAFNGVVLISVALDFDAIVPGPGHDRSYPLSLPSFAAVAAYHHALPHPPAKLQPFLDEVRKFALGEYSAALLAGDALDDRERVAVAEKLHEYTGLATDYLEKARLRVRPTQFTQELLRERHQTLGLLDGRFTGTATDPLAEDSDYDPQSTAIAPAFTAAFMDYYQGELKFGQDKTYRILNLDANQAWDLRHHVTGGFPLPLADTAPDLAHAMVMNPHLRVLTVNGIYDLTTPFLATDSMIDHLGLEKEARARIQAKYYEAGHMMYVHEPSLKQFKADVAAFIDATSRR
jgi:carboxypeptidase C (cathepsin A)